MLGLCISDDKAFVVGSTTGKMEGKEAGGGFVMKIDVDTLDVIWKKQLVGVGVEATYCDIHQNNLFVGGMVASGTHLEEKTYQDLSDSIDVFVAHFDAYDGEMSFLRQIDSHRDDQLVGLKIHPISGEAFLTANAWSSDKDTVNLYILSISQQGAHGWQNLEAGEDPITGMIPTRPEDDPITGMIPTQPPVEERPSDPSNDNKKNDNATIIAAITIPLFVIVVVMTGYFHRKPDKEIIFDDLELDTNAEEISDENEIV